MACVCVLCVLGRQLQELPLKSQERLHHEAMHASLCQQVKPHACANYCVATLPNSAVHYAAVYHLLLLWFSWPGGVRGTFKIYRTCLDSFHKVEDINESDVSQPTAHASMEQQGVQQAEPQQAVHAPTSSGRAARAKAGPAGGAGSGRHPKYGGRWINKCLGKSRLDIKWKCDFLKQHC